MTPSWLENGAVFVDDLTEQKLCIYSKKTLGTATEVRKRGGLEIIAAVVLGWLKYEKESRAMLLLYLKDAGLEVSEIMKSFDEMERREQSQLPRRMDKRRKIDNCPRNVQDVDADIESQKVVSNWDKPFIYIQGISVFASDLQELQDGKKINDHVVNSFLSIICTTSSGCYDMDSAFFLSS